MQVVLLGTGVPVPRVGMAESSLAICVADEVLLFDCGYGTTHQLLKAQIDTKCLSHIFFTHHHYDHNADYAHVVLSTWVQGRHTPLSVYGPRPTQRISTLLFHDIYAEDIHDRAGAGRPTAAVHVAAHDIEGGFSVVKGDRWRVTALTVTHANMQALGYVVEAEGKKVVISGDTGPELSVQEAARNADLLVHEVRPRRPGEASDRERWSVGRGHTTVGQLARLAAAARVPRLALTHLAPLSPARGQQVVAELREHYKGEVIVGQDGLLIVV